MRVRDGDSVARARVATRGSPRARRRARESPSSSTSRKTVGSSFAALSRAFERALGVRARSRSTRRRSRGDARATPTRAPARRARASRRGVARWRDAMGAGEPNRRDRTRARARRRRRRDGARGDGARRGGRATLGDALVALAWTSHVACGTLILFVLALALASALRVAGRGVRRAVRGRVLVAAACRARRWGALRARGWRWRDVAAAAATRSGGGNAVAFWSARGDARARRDETASDAVGRESFGRTSGGDAGTTRAAAGDDVAAPTDFRAREPADEDDGARRMGVRTRTGAEERTRSRGEGAERDRRQRAGEHGERDGIRDGVVPREDCVSI